MKRATNTSPVAVSHPVTGQYITVSRGMEFADDDPIVDHHSWLFTPDEEAVIETASAAPGERRLVRRTPGQTGR